MRPRPPGGSFRLSETQSDLIFQDDIVPHLAGAEPQSQPILIVVSGQPGAGKTVLTDALRDRFADAGGATSVDIDMLKPFHPHYRDCWVDGVESHAPLASDCAWWFEQSLDHLAETRVNVIAEHSLIKRWIADALLDRFHQAGYRTEGALVATPAPASRLNVLARYQVACERSGHGRHTPDDHHDQRFEHINTVADWYDANGRVAASAVYRRGQAEPIHRNERGTTGRWREPARTREVLTEERTRMWTAEETQAFLDLHRSLAERMEPRWRIALSNARTAAEPFLASEPIELAIESAPWPAAPDTAGASPVLPGRSAAPTIGSLGLGL